MSAAPISVSEKPVVATESAPPAPYRWPVVSLGAVVLYWTVTFLLRSLEIPYFVRWLSGMALLLPLFLFFSFWWWSRRRIPLLDRVLGYVLVVGGVFVAGPLSHPSMGIAASLMGWLPMVMSAWVLWAFLWQRFNPPRPRLISLLTACLVWGSMLLLRNEGMDGDLKGDYHWRWSRSSEERFLADNSARKRAADDKSGPEKATAAKLQVSAEDWTGFRGPHRDGKVDGTSIDTDWKQHPPKLLWKQRIGPGWSSMCVIGERLFTQEQRGEKEAVVCYAAATGRQMWVHEDAARFYESVSSAGPRATPTFADGRIYTQGATGIFNCLDAATGDVVWRHDLKSEAEAVLPMWGMSTSPLVTRGLAIVYGGGPNHPNLLAYDAQTGKPVWAAVVGTDSYASPHLATLEGQEQVLFLCDHGLFSVDPKSGKELWHAGQEQTGAPRSLQPQIVDEQRLLLGTFALGSVSLISVAKKDAAWNAGAQWTSASTMKAEFSDLIAHQGHAYGFDGAIFCCFEIESGERMWKGGRYGRGQALLLADQDLLLVLSEKGEAVLVEATSEGHHELARIQAIKGKTWNHPVLVRNRLFVRNAEEIACYELAQKQQ